MMSTLSVINLVLSAINAYFAYDSFKLGQRKQGYINLTVSAICFVAAVV